MDSDFRRQLFSALLDHCFTFCSNNHDFVRYRFNWRGHVRWWWEDQLHEILSRFGLTRAQVDLNEAKTKLDFILDNLTEFESLYHLLADSSSRGRLIEVLLLRILGERHVRLSSNNQPADNCLAELRKCRIRKNTTVLPNYLHSLDLYKLAGKEGPIQLHANGFTVRNTFLLEQYAYHSGHVDIQADPYDVVIDGGGCWGDTALFFADRVGKFGKVHSFEFNSQNISVFRENLRLNGHLSAQVELVPYGLWDVSGKNLGSNGGGAGAALSLDTSFDTLVDTMSIDDFVQGCATKVNFIKLDIEGAELKALRGAENTLRRFRPKLSVCLYHSMLDFIRIPSYLDGLALGYHFYLGHVTMNHEETVLFATPQ